jgi:signal transduction histidine kinase
LVCNNNGNIIESNPAVNKLLGKSIKNLHDLDEIGELIINSTENMRTTSQWHHGDKQDTLSIQLSIASIQGKVRKVVSLQSIHDQLQIKEQQAYKRLTKVLTHEIANSITPLSSLAQTCISLIPSSLSFTDDEVKQDLKLALVTLSSRTQHLREFISRFRQMSSLPKPNVASTDLLPILTRIIALYRKQASTHSIELILSVSSQQLVMLDGAQIEQVVINIVKNSLEVLAMYQAQNLNTGLTITPEIRLTLAQNCAQQYYLEIADNGPGIAKHLMDMIFVPFFTTKQEGSGIGLSLSRQIMQNHGGDLIYLIRPKGACFRCVFG